MRHAVATTDCMSRRKAIKIRIKNDPQRAIISVPDEVEPSDEMRLFFAAWILFPVWRKFRGVEEVELRLDESRESDEQL